MRYESANLQPQGSTLTGSGGVTASRVATSSIQSLAQRLETFEGRAFKQAGEQASQEAIEQAAKDDINGAEFHKESIHTVYGKAYNDTRSASYTANAELDLNNRSGQIAEQFQNDPEGYRKAMQAYTDTLKSDAPTPEIQSVIAITGKKLNNYAFGKLTIAKNTQIKETQKEEYSQSISLGVGQLVNALSIGDTKTAELLRDKMEKQSTTMIEGGVIEPDEYLKIKDIAEYQTKRGVLENNLNDLIVAGKLEEAQDLVFGFNEKIPEDLSPTQYSNIKTSLNKTFSRAINKKSGIDKAVIESNKISVNEAIKILKSGDTPENLDTADNVVGTLSLTKQREYDVAKKVQGIVSQYETKTLKEQELALETLEADKNVNILEKEVMDGIKEIYNQKLKLAKNDPITYGASTGIEIEPLSFEDLGGLPTRISQAKAISKDTGQPVKILSSDEATQASTMLNSLDTTIEAKLGYIQEITQYSGDDADIMFNQIANKGAKNFGFVGHLSIMGNADAATFALKGFKQDIKVDTTTKLDITNSLSGIFENPKDFNLIQQGVFDYMKGRAIDGEEELTAEDVLTSTLGTIKNYNGQNTILPYGMDEDTFEDYMDSVVIKGKTKLTEALNNLTDFWSPSGTVQLHYAGSGKYYIYSPNNGNGFYEEGEDGKALILEVK